MEALLTLVESWLTTSKGRGTPQIRSVHIFWSMQEIWAKEPAEEGQAEVGKLLDPTSRGEVAKLREVIVKLRGVGHQIYVSLYAGIP